MDLEKAINVGLDATKRLRTPRGIADPVEMSEQMMRLAQAAGATEEHLAQYEKEYELEYARKLHQYLVTEGASATNAEKRVRIDLAEHKAQLAYLTRLISSWWKQVSTIQSRWNHLSTEFKSGSKTT